MLWNAPRFSKPRRPAEGALQQVYDRAATSWQDGISKLGFHEAYAHLIREALPPSQNFSTVLDAGTGTGALAQAFVSQYGPTEHMTLLDISPAMLSAAAERFPGATPLCAGIGDSLPELAPQDLILSAHVIEHLEDPIAALRWMHARLRPGGQLVLALSKPHWCTALVRWRWGNAAFPPAAALTMLADAGFGAARAIPFPEGPPSRVSCGYTAWHAI